PCGGVASGGRGGRVDMRRRRRRTRRGSARTTSSNTPEPAPQDRSWPARSQPHVRGQPVFGQELLKRPTEAVPLIDEHALEKWVVRYIELPLQDSGPHEFRVQPARGADLKDVEAAAAHQGAHGAGIEEVHVLGVDRERKT